MTPQWKNVASQLAEEIHSRDGSHLETASVRHWQVVYHQTTMDRWKDVENAALLSNRSSPWNREPLFRMEWFQ